MRRGVDRAPGVDGVEVCKGVDPFIDEEEARGGWKEEEVGTVGRDDDGAVEGGSSKVG